MNIIQIEETKKLSLAALKNRNEDTKKALKEVRKRNEEKILDVYEMVKGGNASFAYYDHGLIRHLLTQSAQIKDALQLTSFEIKDNDLIANGHVNIFNFKDLIDEMIMSGAKTIYIM